MRMFSSLVPLICLVPVYGGDPQRAAPELPTPAELAAKVANHLRAAENMTFEAVIKHGEMKPVTVKVAMTRGKLRLDIFRDQELIGVLNYDGKEAIEWFKDERGNESMYARYPLSSRDGIRNLVLGDYFYGCAIGTLLAPWPGPESRQAEGWMRIGRGKHVGVKSLEGIPCDVVERAGKVVTHRYFIDKKLPLVRRWETVNNGILRIRDYQNVDFPATLAPETFVFKPPPDAKFIEPAASEEADKPSHDVRKGDPGG